jgi:uncharacterized protein (PEP-CTERM system associated)
LCERRAPKAVVRARVSGRAARRLAGVTLLSVLSAYAGWASGAPRWQPSVSVSGEFSDNVDLDPEDEKAAFITRVTPGLSFRGYTSRFKGGFDGALGTRYTTAGEDQGFKVDGALTGTGDLQLVRDVLFLEGDASVSQEVLNAAEAQSDANLDTVQVYRVSLVLRNRFGGFAISELRYILGQVFVSSNDAGNTTFHGG